jgi:hypothetical protein
MFCFKSAKWLTAPSGQHYSASAVALMLAEVSRPFDLSAARKGAWS